MVWSAVTIVVSGALATFTVGLTWSYGRARDASMMSRTRLVAPLRDWLRSVSALAVLSSFVVASTPNRRMKIATITSMIVKPASCLRASTRLFTGEVQRCESGHRQKGICLFKSARIVSAGGAVTQAYRQRSDAPQI